MTLTPTDVAAYTNGRLDAEAAQVWLDRGLAIARRWCGWQVTTVTNDEVTLDGPGSRLLVLPTLKLVELTVVVEDGTAVDVADLLVSARGLVRGLRVDRGDDDARVHRGTGFRCGGVVGDRPHIAGPRRWAGCRCGSVPVVGGPPRRCVHRG